MWTNTRRFVVSTHTQTSNGVATLTISAAARYLECSEKSIRRRIQSGDLPASMINGTYRIRQVDLDAMPAIATRGARHMSPTDIASGPVRSHAPLPR
ncbi:helix-turn-helix domain-containing protein [Corynebacterium sp.]|uniref:helix-turn-helix domain-containing protein n=1 Tax=Corynebacterium sp. TaxID=1720 RepID=UPI00341C7645